MAWNLAPPPSLPTASLRFQALQRLPAKGHTAALITKPTSSERRLSPCRAAGSQEATEEPGSTARTQLDLLEQLTSSTSPGSGYESDGDLRRPTIREQLAELIQDREGEFSLPLGKRLKKASVDSLTISQKRNIKRQAYLNEVARRNDYPFFATIGAFVILPPVVILSIAVLTGYVQLFP